MIVVKSGIRERSANLDSLARRGAALDDLVGVIVRQSGRLEDLRAELVLRRRLGDAGELVGDGKAAAPTPEPSPSPGGPKPVKENKKLTKGVFLVRNNRAVFAPVETGITGENDIEITKGLSPGDEIIIGPYRQLRGLKNDSQIKREDKTKKAPPKDNK